MRIGTAALDAIDWSCLLHAYGRADDTPDPARRYAISVTPMDLAGNAGWRHRFPHAWELASTAPSTLEEPLPNNLDGR